MLLLLLCALVSPLLAALPITRTECEWRNKTKSETATFAGRSLESDCLYYFLTEAEKGKTLNPHAFFERPPPEKNINITVDDVVIRHVELNSGSTYQFNIYGDIYLTWVDSRLRWKGDEWSLPSLTLADDHKIWTPPLIDHDLCVDAATCQMKFSDQDVDPDGQVYARAEFRIAAYCAIDYTRYPEEENNCCIYFTAFEVGKSVSFNKMEDLRGRPEKPVVVKQRTNRAREMSQLSQDHTAWVITSQSVSVTRLMSLESMQVLKVCVKAEKKMATLSMALRLPVTIATLLMLVAPLFGDLRTQAFVKLITLCLQTICFLYLCSIAPENGFAGFKPKVYRFYESVFAMTTVSMLITIGCMALSRAKRTVPPAHRVFLAAKLVNRSLCCIEPENAAHYQRYLEDQENQPAANESDFTQDWRHIYMAVNNLFSGFFFTLFVILSLSDAF